MKVWIDLDNPPHVTFFRPIITELEKKGYCTFVTIRRAFQIQELADKSERIRDYCFSNTCGRLILA